MKQPMGPNLQKAQITHKKGCSRLKNTNSYNKWAARPKIKSNFTFKKDRANLLGLIRKESTMTQTYIGCCSSSHA